MKILFRVDSGRLIGSGHLMRCLNLANELNKLGAEIFFLTKNHEGNISSRIPSKFTLIELKSSLSDKGFIDDDYSTWNCERAEAEFARIKDIINDKGISHLVCDHYALDLEFDNLIMSLPNLKYMVIDDIKRVHNCDFLIDQNFDATNDSYYNSSTGGHYLGPRYALIRPDFKDYNWSSESNIITVFFGGNDLTDETHKVVKAIEKVNSPFHFNIILSSSCKSYPAVFDISKRLKNVSLYSFIEDFPKILGNSLLMLGASGTTNWERACIGLPSKIITIADNQINIAESLSRENLIDYLGSGHDSTYETWIDQLENIDIDQLKQQSEKLKKLTQGRGTEIISSCFLYDFIDYVDCSEEQHLEILKIRNLPEVRKFMANEDLISEEEHMKFVTSLKGRSDKKYFIIHNKSELLGSFNLTNISKSSMDIGLFKNPKLKYPYIGQSILNYAEEYGKKHKIKEMKLYLKKGNEKALKSYSKFGFKVYKTDSIYIYMNYEL